MVRDDLVSKRNWSITMINTTEKEFYNVLRSNPALWAEMAQIEGHDKLCSAIVETGQEMGYALDPDHVRSVAPEDLMGLIGEAANDDELTDQELELVAAGHIIIYSGTLV